jgi:transposase InsO family protein
MTKIASPQIDTELRALIRQMSVENLLWGAPRIHGELLKLGFEIAQSSVAKYMVKRCGPPSQGWSTFLRNHAPDIAAMDFFVVPTIGFKLLYGFVIIRLDRRDFVWINVTTNPTAEWVARQITEAFPWDEAPRCVIRDRDQIYGAVVTRRLRAMGIRDKPITPASPWQNGFAERLIGSIRRECLDQRVRELLFRAAFCKRCNHRPARFCCNSRAKAEEQNLLDGPCVRCGQDWPSLPKVGAPTKTQFNSVRQIANLHQLHAFGVPVKARLYGLARLQTQRHCVRHT